MAKRRGRPPQRRKITRQDVDYLRNCVQDASSAAITVASLISEQANPEMLRKLRGHMRLIVQAGLKACARADTLRYSVEGVLPDDMRNDMLVRLAMALDSGEDPWEIEDSAIDAEGRAALDKLLARRAKRRGEE